MNATQLLAHFDRLAEAPNAVPRLRSFILDLAVRGKLVEQDARDEPAGELLKRIGAEKARLIKDGKLKRGLEEATTDDSEPRFMLPLNWVWAQLGEVAQYGISDKVDSNAAIPSNTWVLDLEDIEKDTSRLLNQVESEARPFSSNKTAFKRGDVLFGKLRPYLNKVIVADRDGVCTTEIIPIRGYCGLAPEYTKLVLRSPLTMATVDRLMYGMKMPRLGTADATALSYPLPPLAEQHRIVAKVDELMALCDQLEAAQQERERRRDHLAAASLQRLNQPAADITPEAQRQHIRFHLHHLPRLTTRSEHIKAMRQAILNLAVRGLLLKSEGVSLPKPVALKPDAQSAAGIDSPVYSEALALMSVPTHWGIFPLASVSEEIVDCPHSTPVWAQSGKICVRTSQFRPGYLDLSNVRFVSQATYAERILRLVPRENDILYSREGGILGVACRVPAHVELCLGQRMMLIRAGKTIAPIFLELVLNSPLITEIARGRTTGGAAPRVNVATVKAYPIPLPPLAEQHRIVSKVDELMALCDQLEAQLTTTQTDSRRLLEAVLGAAFKKKQQHDSATPFLR